MTARLISTSLLLVFLYVFGDSVECKGQAFYCRKHETGLLRQLCDMRFIDLVDFRKMLTKAARDLAHPITQLYFKYGKVSTIWKILADRNVTKNIIVMDLKDVEVDIEHMTLSRGYFPVLTSLLLKDSNISDISKLFDFGKSSRVMFLSLENNKIEHLPDRLFGNLYSLVLSGNPIQNFTNRAFYHLLPNDSRIQYLYMKSCALKSLQRNMFRGLQSLVSIDLSHNNVHYIENGFFEEIKQVEFINLSHNNIASTLTIQGVLKTIHLDLSANRITSLKFKGQFGTLTELFVNDNDLKDFSGIPFNKMEQLRILNLDMNEIDDLDDPLLFSNSKQLKKVILRSTKYVDSNGHQRTAPVFCHCPKTTSKQILQCALESNFNVSEYEITKTRVLQFQNTKCEVIFTRFVHTTNYSSPCEEQKMQIQKADSTLLVILSPLLFGAVFLVCAIITYLRCRSKRGKGGIPFPPRQSDKVIDLTV